MDMECKKCGTPVVDGATYCRNCGARVDGKIPCPVCKKLNDDINAYCIYCGTRIDGKTVCTSCGTAHKGVFCPACGKPSAAVQTAQTNQTAQINQTVAHKTSQQKPQTGERNGIAVAKKVLDITSGGVAMLGVLFALIFVFFIGIASVAPGEISEDGNGIFYYFGEYYKELKNTDYSSGMTDWFAALTQRQGLFFGVTATVVSVGVLASVVTFAILATVTYVRNWLGYTQKKADKWAIACIISFFIGSALFVAIHNIDVSGSAFSFLGYSASIGANSATQIGIFLCAFALASYVGCRAVVMGFEKKKQMLAKDNILRMVFALVGVTAASVVFGIAKNTGFTLEISGDGEDAYVRMSFSLINMMAAVMFGSMGGNYDGYREASVRVEVTTILNWAAQVLVLAVIVLTAIILFKNLRALHSENDKPCVSLSVFTFALSVLTLVLFIVSWICFRSAMQLAEFEGKYSTNFASVICLVLFSGAQMAVAIVKKSLQKGKNV